MDTVYKLHDVPNNLVITFRYDEGNMEEHVRLRNYLTLDLSDCLQRKYVNKKKNPFSSDGGGLPQIKYKLISMVSYEDRENYESSYHTFVRQPDQSWIKYSRTKKEQVQDKDLDNVTFPYALIFERDWEIEKAREQLLAEWEEEDLYTAKSTMYDILT